MSLLGQRLAGRCWPGPVTLVFSGRPRPRPAPPSAAGRAAVSLPRSGPRPDSAGPRRPLAHAAAAAGLVAWPNCPATTGRGPPCRRGRRVDGGSAGPGDRRRPQPGGGNGVGRARRGQSVESAPQGGRVRRPRWSSRPPASCCSSVPATPVAVRWPAALFANGRRARVARRRTARLAVSWSCRPESGGDRRATGRRRGGGERSAPGGRPDRARSQPLTAELVPAADC